MRSKLARVAKFSLPIGRRILVKPAIEPPRCVLFFLSLNNLRPNKTTNEERALMPRGAKRLFNSATKLEKSI